MMELHHDCLFTERLPLTVMLQAFKSLTADNAILCPSFQLEQRTDLKLMAFKRVKCKI